VFSFIGYVTQEVVVNGRTTVDIALATAATDLDEVVVVGYSTQKRANVIGSVTAVNGADLKAVPATKRIYGYIRPSSRRRCYSDNW
jgi:hypothetical protein